MRCAGWATVWFLLAGCAAPVVTPEQGVARPAPVAGQPGGSGETITLRLNSWGLPLAYWQVKDDGTGEIWRISTRDPRGDYDVSRYHFALPEEAGVPFIAATEQVREAAVKGLECRRTIADMPYGAMTWTYPAAERKLDFDFGCTSDSAGKVYQAIGRATEVIEKMARIDKEPFAVDHYVGGQLQGPAQ